MESTAARSTEPQAPSTSHQAWTLVLASIGLFMTALDTLVVTTALPALREDLGASLSNLEWTVNAYNLAFACGLLTGAALGDRFGRRRMFTSGILLFTAASAGAALSPDVNFLICARVLQGLGAAVVMPLSLTLTSEAFPAEKRGMAIGIWGGIAGLAVAAGPVVGGAIVNGLDWHWIFWINVPVGLVLAPIAARKLSESFGPRPQLDVLGVLLAAAGLFALTWGLVRSNTVGWGSAEVVASFAGGAILLTAFVAWERRASEPVLSLDLFRIRGFSTANGVSFFMYAGLFGAVFLMSQYLQNVLGNSPLEAGLRILPWTATPMIIAPIAGGLADRFGNRPFMVAGLTLQGIGLAWVASIAATDTSYAELGIALTVAGVGTSLCFPTVDNAVMQSVPMADAGIASGTNSSVRELGGVFGVALLATIFSHAGGYESASTFVDGFKPALWVAAGLSAAGLASALLAPGKRRESRCVPGAAPALSDAA
jgi:EmrB/QacA subfamily drug resistance transporter